MMWFVCYPSHSLSLSLSLSLAGHNKQQKNACYRANPATILCKTFCPSLQLLCPPTPCNPDLPCTNVSYRIVSPVFKLQRLLLPALLPLLDPRPNRLRLLGLARLDRRAGVVDVGNGPLDAILLPLALGQRPRLVLPLARLVLAGLVLA